MLYYGITRNLSKVNGGALCASPSLPCVLEFFPSSRFFVQSLYKRLPLWVPFFTKPILYLVFFYRSINLNMVFPVLRGGPPETRKCLEGAFFSSLRLDVVVCSVDGSPPPRSALWRDFDIACPCLPAPGG